MSLTLQQILNLASTFTSVNFDNYFTDTTSQVAVANRALRLLGREAYLIESQIPVTFQTGVYKYSLRDPTAFGQKMVRVHQLYINALPVVNGTNNAFGPLGFNEFQARYPDWASPNLSPSAPYGWCVYGTTMLVTPPPSSTVAGYATNWVVGQYIPPDMSTSTVVGTNGLNDPPPLPEELHEPMAYLIARMAAEPAASDAQQIQLLQEYDSQWSSLLKRIARDNRSQVAYAGQSRGGYLSKYRFG